MTRTNAPAPTPIPAIPTVESPLPLAEELVDVDRDEDCEVAWNGVKHTLVACGHRVLTVAKTVSLDDIRSPDRSRTAMLFAPIPCPEVAMT